MLCYPSCTISHGDRGTAGFLEGPVAITNTHSVGVVRDAIIAWSLKHPMFHQDWSLPVVGIDGHTVPRLPHEQLQQVLKK
jgi:hypothetical protein